MAELAVNAALVVIGTVQIVSTFRKKHKDVQEHLGSMKNWLSLMNAFMKDNYGRQGSKMVEDQVERARDIAYDIEVMLEEINYHSPPYSFHSHEFSREIHHWTHQVSHKFPVRYISKKMASIAKDIDDFKSANAIVFSSSFQQIASASCSSTRRFGPPLLNHKMVGYEEERRECVLRLLDGERGLVTLAVNGPGGSGKTTFAKNIFGGKEILGKFDCHAWVRVSQQYDGGEFLLNLLKELCDSRNEPYAAHYGSGSATPRKLQQYLTGKRYIIVLDDIWKVDDWISIKNDLPESSCGSRIIVTTRSSDLAMFCASSRLDVFTLNGLEWLQGWRLFCRITFADNNGECPEVLKDCSFRIAKRCEGLPLAIVAVASALSRKTRLPNEWKKFHDNLGCGSNLPATAITNALLPSFLDLSTNLKCCFLYFSIFPEDYSVKRGRLLRLWVSECFAVVMGSKTAEEVAEEYLNELICRNLVHVSKWDFDGRPKNLRVLNLVHDFIIQKCKDENFTSIFSTKNVIQNNKIRRLAVHGCTNLPENSDFGGVRSMFLLGLINESPCDFENHLRKLKLVRVLDFQGAPLTEFPKRIAHLTLIKYLSFRDTKIKIIPTSIKKLSHLETLDLRQTDVTELPREISYLHKLRHLFAYKDNVDNVEGVKVHRGINNLENLQDLCFVKIGRNADIIKELTKLIRLRKLGLTGLRREHGKDLSAALESMENLTTLDLCSTTKEEYLPLVEMKEPLRTLQRLYMKGRLLELPKWISSLDNLLRIGLKWSKMEQSPLTALERLPNLTELHLVDCFIGVELTFEASHFKKLKILRIEDLSKLHTVVVEDGAMPELEKMWLGRCPQLRMFPFGAHNLINIEELVLSDMSEELIARLRIGGEDRDSVERIPRIRSFNTQSRSSENLSGSF